MMLKLFCFLSAFLFLCSSLEVSFKNPLKHIIESICLKIGYDQQKLSTELHKILSRVNNDERKEHHLHVRVDGWVSRLNLADKRQKLIIMTRQNSTLGRVLLGLIKARKSLRESGKCHLCFLHHSA